MQDEQQVNLSYNYIVLDTIKRLRDAKAAGRKAEYCDLFDFALQLLVPYIDINLRKTINEDWNSLQEAIKQAKKEEKSEASRKRVIEELRENFADTHRSYVFSTLSKVGITRVSEEGKIDFNKLGLDNVAHIIRSGDGIATATAKELKKKGEKNANSS